MTEDPREPVEAVLQRLLRQGRLDPAAERLAVQGIERVREFLGGPRPGGSSSSPRPDAKGASTGRRPVVPSAAEPVGEEDAAPAEDADTDAGRSRTMRHVVPLADGARAEVVVPEHLTRADAERIARVLAALALDEE